MAKYILGRQAKNRSLIIRYCSVIGLTVFFIAILQTSVFSRIKPFGATPDLMIATVTAISVLCGYHTGAITGIVAGFLIDALGSTGFSILPLVYFLLGYLVGYYTKIISAQGFLSYLVCLVISLVVRALTSLLCTYLVYRQFSVPTFLLKVALPEAIGTMVFGIVLFFPIFLLVKWLKKKE